MAFDNLTAAGQGDYIAEDKYFYISLLTYDEKALNINCKKRWLKLNNRQWPYIFSNNVSDLLNEELLIILYDYLLKSHRIPFQEDWRRVLKEELSNRIKTHTQLNKKYEIIEKINSSDSLF